MPVGEEKVFSGRKVWYNGVVAIVAQLVEQLIRNEQVTGSIPANGSIFCLVLVINLFSFNNWETDEFGAIEVGVMKFDGGNLVIIIGGVVEGTFV